MFSTTTLYAKPRASITIKQCINTVLVYNVLLVYCKLVVKFGNNILSFISLLQHGFSFSVFWDLYCASPERRESYDHSSEAKAFHDYVSI